MAQDFLRWDMLGTLSAASGVVIVVSNTVRQLSRIPGPYVPFVISVIVTYGAAVVVNKLTTWPEWVLAFLLFCTATGAQEVVVKGAADTPPPSIRLHGRAPVRWLSSWLTW
jgi:hypothetical protein